MDMHIHMGGEKERERGGGREGGREGERERERERGKKIVSFWQKIVSEKLLILQYNTKMLKLKHCTIDHCIR